MKLSTMLLPTGEFILIVAGVDLSNLVPTERERAQTFRDSIGAAGVLFLSTAEDLEIDNAFFDSDARRADRPAITWGPEPEDEPWTPKPGDRVLCHGRSAFGTNIEGQPGVVFSDSRSWPGRIQVKLEKDRNTVTLEPSQVELLPRNIEAEVSDDEQQ